AGGRAAQVAAAWDRRAHVPLEPTGQLFQVCVVERGHFDATEEVEVPRAFGLQVDAVGELEGALEVLRRAVPGHAAAGADQHEIVGERIVTRDRVPRR